MFTPADTAHNSIMADLVIHEFDQWPNRSNATVAAGGNWICWYGPDHELGSSH